MCEEAKRGGAGDRGAINPSDEPRDVRLILETPSNETNEKKDRTSDTRAFPICIGDPTEGELGSAAVVGRALSLALRLRNKYSGINQTHIAKNDAISVKL